MLIYMKHGSKIYGSRESTETKVLDDVELNLDEGGIYVILGPSGAGKSTLMNMLGGLDTLTSGTLEIGGTDISKAGKKELLDFRRKNVGFVFQSYNLISDLTIRENIQVVADIAENPLEIDPLMKALGIDSLSSRFPGEISGGQQQRVAIARAMIKNPRILLCDELTGALDTTASKKVLNLVENMNVTYHTTVIIITHNEAIAKMADAVIRIRDGKIISCQKNEKKISAAVLEL